MTIDKYPDEGTPSRDGRIGTGPVARERGGVDSAVPRPSPLSVNIPCSQCGQATLMRAGSVCVCPACGWIT
jgi:hypothetical protein